MIDEAFYPHADCSYHKANEDRVSEACLIDDPIGRIHRNNVNHHVNETYSGDGNVTDPIN